MDFGYEIHQHFKGAMLFKMLSGSINNFEKVAVEVAEVKDFNDPDVRNRLNYLFAVALSLPQSYVNSQQREKIDDEIDEIDSKHFSTPKSRHTLEVRVLRSVYSKNWETYFTTAVHDEKHVMFFATPRGFSYGDIIKIKGTVKMHRDGGQTQLNRVKLIED